MFMDCLCRKPTSWIDSIPRRIWNPNLANNITTVFSISSKVLIYPDANNVDDRNANIVEKLQRNTVGCNAGLSSMERLKMPFTCDLYFHPPLEKQIRKHKGKYITWKANTQIQREINLSVVERLKAPLGCALRSSAKFFACSCITT